MLFFIYPGLDFMIEVSNPVLILTFSDQLGVNPNIF